MGVIHVKYGAEKMPNLDLKLVLQRQNGRGVHFTQHPIESSLFKLIWLMHILLAPYITYCIYYLQFIMGGRTLWLFAPGRVFILSVNVAEVYYNIMTFLCQHLCQ